MTGRKMKKILVLIIALTFILSAASLSFGAEEFQMKGKVTRINGDQKTITDDKGKEMTVEGSGAVIKVGDAVLLKGEIFKPVQPPDLKLSPQDIEFLTKQCHIDSADVEVIPKLNRRAKLYIRAFLPERDCTLMEPFKQSREFLRKFTPPPENSPLPPRGYSHDYLTEEEGNYVTEISGRIYEKKLGFKIKKIKSQMKGTVTRITNNQTTITDDKGKETTVEGSAPYIKVGDAVILKIQIFQN